MASTDKGYSSKKAEDLVKQIGQDLSFVSFRKGGFTLTYGETEKGRYFRMSVAAPGVPMIAGQIGDEHKAVKAFELFRKNGFSPQLRSMFRWRDGEVRFHKEPGRSKTSRPKATRKPSRSSQSEATDLELSDVKAEPATVLGQTEDRFELVDVPAKGSSGHSGDFPPPSLFWWAVVPGAIAGFLELKTSLFLLVCGVIALFWGWRNAVAFGHRNGFTLEDLKQKNASNAFVAAFVNGIVVAGISALLSGLFLRWLMS